MSRLNGKGPGNQGPRTGRGLGECVKDPNQSENHYHLGEGMGERRKSGGGEGNKKRLKSGNPVIG